MDNPQNAKTRACKEDLLARTLKRKEARDHAPKRRSMRAMGYSKVVGSPFSLFSDPSLIDSTHSVALRQRCNQYNTQFVLQGFVSKNNGQKPYLLVEEPKGITLAIKEFLFRH
jgi:hypothetical protein